MANDLTPSEVGATAAMASNDMKGEPGNVVQTCPKVTLEIGVFFDGTLNNAINSQTGGTEGSFANAETNVWLLHNRYYKKERDTHNSCGGYARRYERIYVPGIGTISGQEDDKKGYRWGTGDTGIEERVYKAAIDVGGLIRKMGGGIEPEEVILDVFGFSRGAAAARYFVNGFNAGELRIDDWGRDRVAVLPEGRNIRIRFLGVFDTVAAVGLPSNDNNGDVNVHLKSNSADTIYHLTAGDEFRDSFCLNHNIKGGGETMQLPGAHSNIGGGYKDSYDESPVVERLEEMLWAFGPSMEKTLAEAQARKAEIAAPYVNKGWIDASDANEAIQLEVEYMAAPFVIPGSATTTRYDIKVKLVRQWVKGDLSKIAMHAMHRKAKSSGVPFTDLPPTDDYKIPGDLRNIAETLIAGGSLNIVQERHVRRNYTHHSAHKNELSYGIAYPMKPARNNVRIIFPNDPSKAS